MVRLTKSALASPFVDVADLRTKRFVTAATGRSKNFFRAESHWATGWLPLLLKAFVERAQRGRPKDDEGSVDNRC